MKSGHIENCCRLNAHALTGAGAPATLPWLNGSARRAFRGAGQQEDHAMAKSQDIRKEEKKKPALTLKEKRQAKKAKKSAPV